MGKNSGKDLEMEAGEEIDNKMDLCKHVDYRNRAIQLREGLFSDIWLLLRYASLSKSYK